MECLALLLAGMTRSTKGSTESVSQKAIVGMFMYALSLMGWWSVRGSVTISSRGSSKSFWIWLVNVPAHKSRTMWRPQLSSQDRRHAFLVNHAA